MNRSTKWLAIAASIALTAIFCVAAFAGSYSSRGFSSGSSYSSRSYSSSPSYSRSYSSPSFSRSTVPPSSSPASSTSYSSKSFSSTRPSTTYSSSSFTPSRPVQSAPYTSSRSTYGSTNTVVHEHHYYNSGPGFGGGNFWFWMWAFDHNNNGGYYNGGYGAAPGAVIAGQPGVVGTAPVVVYTPLWERILVVFLNGLIVVGGVFLLTWGLIRLSRWADSL